LRADRFICEHGEAVVGVCFRGESMLKLIIEWAPTVMFGVLGLLVAWTVLASPWEPTRPVLYRRRNLFDFQQLMQEYGLDSRMPPRTNLGSMELLMPRVARLILGWLLIIGTILPGLAAAFDGKLDAAGALVRGLLLALGFWLVLGARRRRYDES
jgi:hypothetical protein